MGLSLVLGSQSAARKKILKDMGYRFTVVSADIDEKAIRLKDPVKLTIALSHAKADALLPLLGKEVVLITSDQVVVCNGAILEKPENGEEVKKFMTMQSKYPAETVTSVVVTNTKTGKRFEGTDIDKIWFKKIPDDVVEKYIATGDPFLCSGGFDHEHPLIEPFVDSIEGERESISGLPKALTEKLIRLATEE